MVNEIGGEFWDIPISNKENGFFPRNVQWFLCGRSALKAIIQDSNIKSIALPSWCCESMIKPFVEEKIDIVFYDIFYDEQVIDCLETDAIFVMDYFGCYGYSIVPENFDGVIIRDLTHSVFSYKYNDADYYFGSLRKWCGFLSGGFAWKTNGTIVATTSDVCEEYINLRKKAMDEKKLFINELINNKGFLHQFELAENIINENSRIYKGYEPDATAAIYMDIDYIKRKRVSNANILMNELNDYCIFKKLKKGDCPLFVPIMVKNRNEIVKYLIKNLIYCPVHWPISKYHMLNEKSINYYNNEISLVCDQRYNEKDMERIVRVVKEGIEICCE